ncbi:MAG: membrane protein insertion efficiency factor YidD [Candidatus Omnitrophica bacterium]|nr:membrane protein insertion efficiency factor YidD [Candidatus Omnitrophota bacterium]
MTKIFIFFIHQYQKFISPFLGNHCRFYPTCSDYCKEALTRKGWALGILLSLKRLLKCHPLHSGGWDPLE